MLEKQLFDLTAIDLFLLSWCRVLFTLRRQQANLGFSFSINELKFQQLVVLVRGFWWKQDKVDFSFQFAI